MQFRCLHLDQLSLGREAHQRVDLCLLAPARPQRVRDVRGGQSQHRLVLVGQLGAAARRTHAQLAHDLVVDLQRHGTRARARRPVRGDDLAVRRDRRDAHDVEHRGHALQRRPDARGCGLDGDQRPAHRPEQPLTRDRPGLAPNSMTHCIAGS